MKRFVRFALISLLSITAFVIGSVPYSLAGAEDDCLTACHDHDSISKGAVVHPAIQLGCQACHIGIDASVKPHRITNNVEKGLASEPPDLCFNCHDKAEFTRKNVHDPVAKGKCLSCHNPHASEEMALLRKKPVDSCLECHADVKKKPHPVAGGHPIGIVKVWQKPIMDPLRTDKELYCGSCHNPHSSDSPKLFRYKAKDSFELCKYCHKEV